MVGLAIPDREARAAVGHCRHGFALFVMSLPLLPPALSALSVGRRLCLLFHKQRLGPDQHPVVYDIVLMSPCPSCAAVDSNGACVPPPLPSTTSWVASLCH